ncbi:DUF3280 domain-containing protein [Methylorubrum populi]
MNGLRLRRFLWLAAAGLPLAALPARADPEPPALAILPLKLLDTSGEPVDQGAEHARRLAAMASNLAADLGGAGGYRTVRLAPETLRARCPDEQPACLLTAAQAAGAGLVFVGVVHKSSTLILQLWARVVDARTGRAVLTRDLNFRGDTDEAWRRAEVSLVGQIRDAATGREP